MATLHVKNIPDDLYEALKQQARRNGNSIAAELRSLLAENLVTVREQRARQRFLKKALQLRTRRPLTPRPFATTEEMQREDRSR